jgi:hypothetical protein
MKLDQQEDEFDSGLPDDSSDSRKQCSTMDDEPIPGFPEDGSDSTDETLRL